MRTSPAGGTDHGLPASVEHEGAALHLQRTTPIKAVYVDDPAVARVKVAAGMELPISDCHPLPVAVVREATSRQVTVSVGMYSPSPELPDELDCSGIGAEPHLVDVDLGEPLGGRELVDEAFGVVDVYSVDDLPEPVVLPDGYSGGQLRLVDGFLSRRWDGPEAQLILERRAAREVSELDVVVLETSVHGVPAVATKQVNFEDSLCLSWGEGEEGLLLCSLGSPTAPLEVETLVTVAESMPALR